jgi:hypothetical protein
MSEGFEAGLLLETVARHRLPVQQAGDKTKALFHHRSRFPWHSHLPMQLHGRGVTHVSGMKCHLCLGPLIMLSCNLNGLLTDLALWMAIS